MHPNQYVVTPKVQPRPGYFFWQVYADDGKINQRFPETQQAEAIVFAKQISQKNPGMSVMVTSDYLKWSEGARCMVSGGRALGWYLNGEKECFKR